MHWKYLEKSLGQRVRLRPMARRFEGGMELPQLDDEWIIQGVSKEGVQLHNTRTDHCPTLGTDHIFSCSTDPDHPRDAGCPSLPLEFGMIRGIGVNLLELERERWTA